MSGGSYEYLCFADDAERLAAQRHNLQAMYERLAELPWAHVAAAETLRLVTLLDRLDARLRVATDLRDVWKAVEWWDSGDSGEESVREAIREYEDSAALLSEPS